MKWNGDEVLKSIESKIPAFLHGAGKIGVNQAGELAHKVSGTLANSITYQLKTGGSEFTSSHGPGSPPASAKIGRPEAENIVRVGSALIYANPQERHNGFMSATLDEIQRSGQLQELAKKVFGNG
jgi:hypothetical protein